MFILIKVEVVIYIKLKIVCKKKVNIFYLLYRELNNKEGFKNIVILKYLLLVVEEYLIYELIIK